MSSFQDTKNCQKDVKKRSLIAVYKALKAVRLFSVTAILYSFRCNIVTMYMNILKQVCHDYTLN